MHRRATAALVGTAALVAALLPTAAVSASASPTRAKDAPLLLHGAASTAPVAVSPWAPQATRPRASRVSAQAFDAASAVLVGPSSERLAATPTPWGLYVGAYTDTAPTPLEVDGHEHDGATATADSSAVVYSRAASGGAFQLDYDLYRIPFAAPSSPVRLTDTVGAELDAENSPDLAYVSYTHYDIDPVNGLVSPSLCVIPSGGAVGTTPTCLAGFSHGSWLTATTLVASDDRTQTGPLVTVPVVAGVIGTPVTLTDPGAPAGSFDGAFDPTVSQSGLYLAYVDGSGRPSVLTLGQGIDDLSGSMNPADAVWFAPRWVASELPAFAGFNAVGDPLGATIPFNGAVDAAEVSAVPVTDTTPPAITGLSASTVKTGTVVKVLVTDAGSRKAPPAVTCGLDSLAVVDCTAGFPTAVVADAHHVLHVTARDVAGNSSTADLALTTDSTPPSVPVVTLPLYTLARTATAKFVSKDVTSGVSSYRLALSGNNFAAAGASSWSGFSGSSADGTFPLKFNGAENSCVQVRAVDAVGNASAYSAKTCITTPLDDRNMVATTSGWARAKGSRNYLGTTTVSKRLGARLQSYNSLGVKQIVVYGTACSTCGSVAVWANGTKVGTISFASRTYVASKAIRVVLPKYRFARIALTTVSTKTVVIDAVVAIAR